MFLGKLAGLRLLSARGTAIDPLNPKSDILRQCRKGLHPDAEGPTRLIRLVSQPPAIGRECRSANKLRRQLCKHCGLLIFERKEPNCAFSAFDSCKGKARTVGPLGVRNVPEALLRLRQTFRRSGPVSRLPKNSEVSFTIRLESHSFAICCPDWSPINSIQGAVPTRKMR